MIVLHILSLGCIPESGSRFGGDFGKYWCMPGPISALINNTVEGFCSEINDTTGNLISECDNSLYIKTPDTASYTTYTTAKVIPGPQCTPAEEYTNENSFLGQDDLVNQQGPEACNCRDRRIRLSINQGTENIDSSEAHAFANGGHPTFSLPSKSPCSFRSASFAWDLRGETTRREDEGLGLPPNNEGFIRPVRFDPDGIQFRGTSQDDETACAPEQAPTCGNITSQNLNELLNYCFIDVSLGLNKEETHFVTQTQVNVLSDVCNSYSGSWPPADRKTQECCQKIIVGNQEGVFIRRDLLLLAGCRSTVHSINNGDGKMHKPDQDISPSMFEGRVDQFDNIPYNFDYQDELVFPTRSGSEATGFNRVCLLDTAYNMLVGSECMTLTSRPVEQVVPDKVRRPIDPKPDIPDDETESLPYYAEGCIMPKYFVDGRPQDVPPEDGLRLFGMFPRNSDHVSTVTETYLELPLYYHIVANSLLGRTTFKVLETSQVIDVLSKMSPSQYLFAGGLSFARHWFRADWGEHFGEDYPMGNINGRTFYAKHCQQSGDWKDTDYTMPVNFCLGGETFMTHSWCEGVRTRNDEHFDFLDSASDSVRIMTAYIMKKNQKYFDDLPDVAVIVVGKCKDKYPESPGDQAACIREATTEFISRANTCHGMPTDTSYFQGRGNNGGVFCKGSQSYIVKNAFTEIPATMPEDQFFLESCSIVNDVYYFDTSAPKLQGFYHPLFYQSYSTKDRSLKSLSKPKSIGSPVETDPSGSTDNTLVFPGLFPTTNLFEELKQVYSISEKDNDLWDFEEAYVYNPECERNQFLLALNDYPNVRIASGGDFRFDANRDGCSNEVKRGNTPQHNFLSSFKNQEGCAVIHDAFLHGHGMMAHSHDVVSPLKFLDSKYSAVKSLLTPAKLAGDVAKPVVTGLVVVGSVALAVGTGGASAAAEVGAEAAAEVGAEAAAEEGAAAASSTFFNPVFEDPGAIGIESIEDGPLLIKDAASEGDLFEDTFSDIFANPSLDGPVEDGFLEAAVESTAEEGAEIAETSSSRTGRILQSVKNAAGKTLRLAGKGAKRIGTASMRLAKKAIKNPLLAYFVYELGKSTVDDVLDSIRESTANYEAEFGKDQKYIETVVAAAQRYRDEFKKMGETCPSNPRDTDGSGEYKYRFGNEEFVLMNKDERGDEYSKKGTDLYPDKLAFSSTGEYEFHPYLSRMTEQSSYRNRVPTFMMGPITDRSIDAREGTWQNVMGAYPPIKLGIDVYCANILDQDQQEIVRPTPFIMYKDKNRIHKMVYGRIPVDKLKRIQRLRKKESHEPVYGSYSDDIDGITNTMKRQCQLCSQYGYPKRDTKPLSENEPCQSNGKMFKWNLAHSLYDSNFNTFVETNLDAYQSTIEMHFGLGTNLTLDTDFAKIEELIGMQLTSLNFGDMLPYSRRACKGDLQSTPAGVPGICEMRQEIAVHEEDTVGLRCPVQQGNFQARCLHPFWHNDHRFLFPSSANGFTLDALTPNYCFNAFDAIKDGSAYQESKANGKFVGWKAPQFDPNSDRYTYCQNDPLTHDGRDFFCKHGGYLSWSGISVGAWNDPDLICSTGESGVKVCIFFPDNPSLTLQQLIDSASSSSYRLKILIVPVSWKVARLLWMYPSTSDHSFFNFANVNGQTYDRLTQSRLKNVFRFGPFAAQKLVFENSAQMMGMCYINTVKQVDEGLLNEVFARMLITVESMRVPESSDYLMPGFDNDIVASNNMSMTVRFKRDEVYPTIVTSPIRLADHPVTLMGAFTPSVLQRASGLSISDVLNVSGLGIIMPKFAPKDKSSCTVFQIGTARTRLQYLHFDQNTCTATEDYLRTPIVYSALDVSESFASDLIIQDAPGPLFKGLDSFDGFDRSYGWTLQTTGTVMQGFIMASSTTNGKPNPAVSGAARVKDTLAVYHCNTSAYHCNDIAIHYRGSLGNLSAETENLLDSANIFACDGVPVRVVDEDAALRLISTLNENTTLVLPEVLDRNPLFLTNTTFDDIVHDSKLLLKRGQYEGFDLGGHHIIKSHSQHGYFSSENVTNAIYVAFNSDSKTPRIIRCSGNGCPQGKASCTETCRGTKTASEQGLLQDWQLIDSGTNTLKLCSQRQRLVCLPGTYRIPEDGEISELSNDLVEEGIFVLMNIATGLCLSQDNFTAERPCDIMNDLQRWELDQYGRIEASGNPYSCISAFANALNFAFIMTCFPCNLGQTAHRKCVDNIEMKSPLLVSSEDTQDEPLAGTIQTLKLIQVPFSDTHSLLYSPTGQCMTSSFSLSSRFCQPECYEGLAAPDMCSQPLGIGNVLCNFESRGSLVALYGSTSKLERGVAATFSVTGDISGAHATIISSMGTVFVMGSDNSFIDKEPLTLNTEGASGFTAGIARVYFQPIDDLSSIKVGGVSLTNVSDVVERFGADVIQKYEEQFVPSPLLYQILVAIEAVSVACILVLHVVLVYKEQQTIKKTFQELDEQSRKKKTI